MLEPVGKKLQQTRIRKNLTVDEVARLTRIHKDRVVDLENDDYSNFPNLSYARSFLTLYAKHLGVDVRDVASSFGRHDQIGRDEYEYLSNTPKERAPAVVETEKRSMLPLMVAAGAVVLALIITFLVVSANRLGDFEAEKRGTADGASRLADTTPPAEPAPADTAPSVGPVIPAVVETLPPAPPGPPGEENVEVRRAVPISEEAAAAAAAAAPANEVVLRPLKKTWVKVRQGGSTSAIIFEDFLYPDARPLTLRGDRFFIQADSDGTNLRITNNGQEVTYRPPGLAIE